MENLNKCKNDGSLDSTNSYSTLLEGVITKEMIDEEKILEEKAIQKEKEIKERMEEEEKDKQEQQQHYERLKKLLSQSCIYAEYMTEKIKRDNLKEEKRQLRAQKMQEKRKKEVVNLPRKRSRVILKELEGNEEEITDENITINLSEKKIEILPDGQPSLLTGGIMHPYQIVGFEWLKTLYENGVNGILADEMGLGKTIQTIAFIAYIIEMGITGPFFICGPLSTVPNWCLEFRKFAPNIPVLLYHGHKDVRKLIRPKMKRKVRNGNVCCFPVVITSYQIAIIDARSLSRYGWKLLVIDEAHRIKNYQCSLITSLKLFDSSTRLLLTGTPLQNNLTELWSLLNFILPEVFDDLKIFESWFDISRLIGNEGNDEIVAKEQEKQIVSIIHQILAPFLLRRTKAEVQLKLPPKKEVIVHAPLTKLQHEYYTAVLNRTIFDTVGLQSGRLFEVKVDLNNGRPERKKNVDFVDIYKQLNDTKFEEIPQIIKKMGSPTYKSRYENVFADINVNMNNISMILRKICGHPYLLSYPVDPITEEYKIDEDLIKNSGKLLVLDAMLPELKKRGHKILLFSQFVTMITILEDYCAYRNYSYNKICGYVNLETRQQEMHNFNTSEDSFIFLISTKAGGLGINLARADTVIIFDSDWNPQGDIQAQDRCHRIGQIKPVVVYRLMIPNTVDEDIINRANAKRKLEKVIIKKGRFNSANAQSDAKLSIEELLELLQASDSTGFVKTDFNNVLSPDELDRLLDRSDMINYL